MTRHRAVHPSWDKDAGRDKPTNWPRSAGRTVYGSRRLTDIMLIKFPAVEIELKRLAASTKRLASWCMSLKERGMLKMSKPLLKRSGCCPSSLESCVYWPRRADHESTGWSFIDRGDHVGERAIREGIVTVGPDVGHIHAGDTRKRAGGLAGTDGRRGGIFGKHYAGTRCQARRRGDVDRWHRIQRRAERVVAERSQFGDIWLGRRPRGRAGRARMQRGQKILAPEPGSCRRACDTSPMRGIIKSP